MTKERLDDKIIIQPCLSAHEIEQLFQQLAQLTVRISELVDRTNILNAHSATTREKVDRLSEKMFEFENPRFIASILTKIAEQIRDQNRHGSELLRNTAVHFRCGSEWTRDLVKQARADMEIDAC